MIPQIRRLQEQREQLHLSLGEFLEEGSSWAQGACPELILEMDRLSELANGLLAELEHARSELDRIAEAGAEEFVRNYIQRPGK